jgi:hypothetical protein
MQVDILYILRFNEKGNRKSARRADTSLPGVLVNIRENDRVVRGAAGLHHK